MNKLLLTSCISISLIGCMTPISEKKNSPPSISGTPTTSISIGEAYTFSAVAFDNDKQTLSYRIDNKPDWASFNEVTGLLSGTPSEPSVSLDVRVGVSDGEEQSFLPTFDITVHDTDANAITVNSIPVLAAQEVTAYVSTEMVITLGPNQDSDGDGLTYTVSNSLNFTVGPQNNQITYLNTATESELLSVAVTDGINQAVNANLTINTIEVTISSNYVKTREIIEPNFGASPPSKGESRVDDVTGAKITRLTDASEMDGTDDALIVYSRYSPENTSGQYVLSFGSNSTSSWVINRTTSEVTNELKHAINKTIGEAHEVRWDLSGSHPNRVYYRYNLALYMIDDVSADVIEPTLVKDFTGLVPALATKLYNDVEGDSSNDSDHWAFMAAHYNGVTYVVDAFVHYQISTDTTHTFTPSDLTGTALDHYSQEDAFPRPNMVEVSPLGTGIVLHYGRAWGDANYGSRSDDIGTWFDGAHIWPLDFVHGTQTPTKISIGETHSGWAYDDAGKELFISQNNRTDQLDAIYITGDDAGYDNRIEMAEHSDFGWSNGFHYGKMPVSKPGWVFINTYSNTASQYHQTDWAADQFIMMELKPKGENPIIWRIAPNYNEYSGNYRDEAPAAINVTGERIYVSTNWGGELPNREVFIFELPQNWDTALSN